MLKLFFNIIRNHCLSNVTAFKVTWPSKWRVLMWFLSKLSDMINAKLRETFKRLSIFEMLIIFLFLLWNTGKASPTDLPCMWTKRCLLLRNLMWPFVNFKCSISWKINLIRTFESRSQINVRESNGRCWLIIVLNYEGDDIECSKAIIPRMHSFLTQLGFVLQSAMARKTRAQLYEGRITLSNG